MIFGCLTSIIAIIFSIVLTILILVFTGVTITLSVFFGLLGKILIPIILIGIGINIIFKKRG